ncbi:MAG: hypothetical protein WC803_02605 [Sphingomonas sp.]
MATTPISAAKPLASAAKPPAFAALRGEYDALFTTCHIDPAHAGEIGWYRATIIKGRAHYDEAAAHTGVPWWFIAIIHGLEAGFRFSSHLHNGDPLCARTVQVPRGRPPIWGPPNDWLSSAIDALTWQGYAGAQDWSAARALYRWEAYNGWGYRRARINIHTPYLWSFSNHYKRGKFVADGKYDPAAKSRQCGAAVMLKALQQAGDINL